jgi:hypothetical protein
VAIPHLLNAVRPTLTTVLLPLPLHTSALDPIPMADFNDNTDSYPTTSAAGDINLYLSQTFGLPTDEGLIQGIDTDANTWGMVGQPDPMIGPSADVLADNCSESYDHNLVSLISI